MTETGKSVQNLYEEIFRQLEAYGEVEGLYAVDPEILEQLADSTAYQVDYNRVKSLPNEQFLRTVHLLLFRRPIADEEIRLWKSKIDGMNPNGFQTDCLSILLGSEEAKKKNPVVLNCPALDTGMKKRIRSGLIRIRQAVKCRLNGGKNP